MQIKEIDIDKRYRVCSNGDIIGAQGRILRPGLALGYCQVAIGGRTMKVHRLVAHAFIPKVEGSEDVNHINGIKTDNRLENLEWSNDSHNISHAFSSGLRTHKGEFNTRNKIPSDHIQIIREAISLGYNPKEIGKYYNVSKNTIYSIKYGKNWSHT